VVKKKVVVLGGGLSGIAAALRLAEAGSGAVTLVEASPRLGGLAGSFDRAGHWYPLGYHHILGRDKTLLRFLDRIGALPAVRWRRIRMLLRVGDRLHDLASPSGFLRFPMSAGNKLRLLRLMLLGYCKTDWSDWDGRSAAELVDAWGGPGVREALFEPLCGLKFELPCRDVSASWLGARLSYREGTAPLGYIPNTNWTTVLCDGLERLLREANVRIITNQAIAGLRGHGDRIAAARLESGAELEADAFVSTLPAPVYLGLVTDGSPGLPTIRYTALLSMVSATRRRIHPDFYWLNLTCRTRRTSGLFILSSLNPTIGGTGETCVNFVTHFGGSGDPRFRLSEGQLIDEYLSDFRDIFGHELEPEWWRLTRVPIYSPVFTVGYRNPPLRSTSWRNVYFAGNYRTHPSVASTGTALASGIEAAEALLAEHLA